MPLLTSHLVRNWFTLCSGCHFKQWFNSFSLSLSNFFLIISYFLLNCWNCDSSFGGCRWLRKFGLNDHISTVYWYIHCSRRLNSMTFEDITDVNATRAVIDIKPAMFITLLRFRVFCHWLCNHNYFGNVILACILISSAMLAAEEPLNTTTDRNLVSQLISLTIGFQSDCRMLTYLKWETSFVEETSDVLNNVMISESLLFLFIDAVTLLGDEKCQIRMDRIFSALQLERAEAIERPKWPLGSRFEIRFLFIWVWQCSVDLAKLLMNLVHITAQNERIDCWGPSACQRWIIYPFLIRNA